MRVPVDINVLLESASLAIGGQKLDLTNKSPRDNTGPKKSRRDIWS